MKTTFAKWESQKMGLKPWIDSLSKLKIDESKIITYDWIVRWKFGIVDRTHYDVIIFFVNDNRTGETLLSIIKKHIYTYPHSIINNRDNPNKNKTTIIFSDYWVAYKERDFNSAGYILHPFSLIWSKIIPH